MTPAAAVVAPTSPTPPQPRRRAWARPDRPLVDLRDPDANTFHAVNQVTIVDGEHERRFDIALYVNGLPLAVIELKSAADEHATLKDAHAQLRTYVDEFPLEPASPAGSPRSSDPLVARWG